MKRSMQESRIIFCAGAAASVLFVVFWMWGQHSEPELYPPPASKEAVVSLEEEVMLSTAASPIIEPPPPTHLPTPEPVRALYMTSWVAGTPSFRTQLVELIDSSEINAVVVDVKDYTGKVVFPTENPEIMRVGSQEDRVPDMRAFVEQLHQRNIYAIARISVFQDPHFAAHAPHLAVHRGDGSVWKDRKGLSWMDPASQEVWDYIVAVAKATERIGFDELNFDYVRFPSDGNMADITYPVWDGVAQKSDVITKFFAYLDDRLENTNVPVSVDLFGFVTSNTDDLNIGQILEKIAPHVDYIAPMVYPSHYPDGYNGYANPAANPYDIIFKAMTDASQRLTAASSTPMKLRPWLQDFDLGADYTSEMIQKEHQAVYDAGLDSWMMWDPKNIYTKEAYK